MKIRGRIVTIITIFFLSMALCTACTDTSRRPEAALWGQWAYAGGENSSLDYAYDLSFQEDGSLILLDRPQDQAAYVVIAPGRIKLTMGSSSEVLNYRLENDTLTLYIGDGHNTYTRVPETRPIAQGEPVTVSTPAQNEIIDNILSGGAHIMPENAARITELRHLEITDIRDLVWSPDGKEIIVVTGNGIYFYDSDRLVERLYIETESRIASLAFSPNGRVLATGNLDGMLQLWNGETGDAINNWEGYIYKMINVAFSPDNAILASTGDDTLKLWDPNSGRLLIKRDVSFLSSIYLVYSTALSFSPDGSILATGSGDNAILFWDPVNGTLIRKIEGHTDIVRDITFSPDGTLLASVGFDGSVRLWDVETGMSLNLLEKDGGYISSASFSPNGQVLASGSGDGTIRLWDVKTAELLYTHEGHMKERWVGRAILENPCSDDPPSSTTPLEDHPYLFVTPTCGEPTKQVAQDETIEVIPGTELRVEGYNFFPGSLVDLFWVDPAGSQFRQRQDRQDVTVIPDENGEFVIDIIWPFRIFPPSHQGGISEWELQGRQTIPVITGKGEKVTFAPSVAFSPDGKTLASWGERTVRLWGIP